MPMIRPNSTEWAGPVTLAADELWQVRDGIALVTFEAVAEQDQGLLLHHKDLLSIPEGKAVRYRALTPGTIIARESA